MINILADAINYYDLESLKFLNLLKTFCSEINLKLDDVPTIDTIIKKLNKDGYIFIKRNLSEYTNTIIFKDDDKIYIKAKFFNLGIIDKNIWYWYWIIDSTKNISYKSQQLLRYGLDIDLNPSEINYGVNLLARGLLINGKIELSLRTNQIFLLKALSVYITNYTAVIELDTYNLNLINVLILYDIENLI